MSIILTLYPGVFSSLPKDPIILVDTPPPPKADGGTQDSDSGKCGLLSHICRYPEYRGKLFCYQTTNHIQPRLHRSQRGVTEGEQPPAHQELNTPDVIPINFLQNQVFETSEKLAKRF